MTFTLDVTLHRTERSLERLMNLIGRRGYEIIDMSVDGTSLEGLYLVRCKVESDRRPETLQRFVGKLYDVESVRIDNIGLREIMATAR